MGFTVQGSGCRVQGSGCRVQGSGFRVQSAGLKCSSRSMSCIRCAGKRQAFGFALPSPQMYRQKVTNLHKIDFGMPPQKASQGYFAYKKTPTPLGPPQDPRHTPSVGSSAGAFSYERGTPARGFTGNQMGQEHPSRTLRVNRLQSDMGAGYRLGSAKPLSSEYAIFQKGKARFWPCLSGQSP